MNTVSTVAQPLSLNLLKAAANVITSRHIEDMVVMVTACQYTENYKISIKHIYSDKKHISCIYMHSMSINVSFCATFVI